MTLLLKNEISQIYSKSNDIRTSIHYLTEQTEDICIEAILRNPFELKYVRNQTEKICAVAVHANGIVLMYVKNKTPQLCSIAVQNCGMALEYVPNKTPELCLEAVKQDAFAIKYVDKPTNEILTLVFRNYSMFVLREMQQTEEIAIFAINANLSNIYYIHDQTYNVQCAYIDKLFSQNGDTSELMRELTRLKHPSIFIINRVLDIAKRKNIPLNTIQFFSKNRVVDLVANYCLYNGVITDIIQHLNKLLYRPNNIGHLLCAKNWNNTYGPKTLFLTL